MRDVLSHWPWAAAAFVLTAALLFGGRSVYVARLLQTPFIHAADHINGVSRVRIDGRRHVDVWLRTDADAATVYASVSELAATDLGHSSRVRLMDNPSPAQQALGRQIALMVAEAEARGNYVAMAGRAGTLAAQHHQQFAWTLGSGHVFVTLTAGSHRLIALYPLHWVGAAAKS